MNAITVLTIIHWVGVVFVFLWFLGSCMKDGMWNNAIRCFNAFVALAISFPMAFAIGVIGGMIMGAPDASDVYTPTMIAVGAAWVSFIVAFAVLQVITDGLSKVKVNFHPVANGIGSFIFICGMTLVVFSLCLPVYSVVRSG